MERLLCATAEVASLKKSWERAATRWNRDSSFAARPAGRSRVPASLTVTWERWTQSPFLPPARWAALGWGQQARPAHEELAVGREIDPDAACRWKSATRGPGALESPWDYCLNLRRGQGYYRTLSSRVPPWVGVWWTLADWDVGDRTSSAALPSSWASDCNAWTCPESGRRWMECFSAGFWEARAEGAGVTVICYWESTLWVPHIC